MKIGIGTANFGQEYGLINQSNIKSTKKISKILGLAINSKIKILDTSPNYGISEKILGKNKLSNFKIVTKIKFLPREKKTKNLNKFIFTKIKRSLLKLKIKKFYAILIHQSSDMKNIRGRKILKILRELKKKKLVSKIGISIYNPQELDEIWFSWKPDIVQCPLNTFDQRIYSSGWLKKLKKYNVEIHVRSVFLQGLLLQSYENIPKKFDNWSNILKKWSLLCKKNNVSKLDACLNFIKSFNNISYVIVGFENINQMEKIIKSFRSSKKRVNFSLPCNDEGLIDPRLW